MPSQEYLAEFHRLARERLKPEDLKTIHARALPSSGGKAAGRDPQPEGLESLGLSKATRTSVRTIETPGIEKAVKRLAALAHNAQKRRRDMGPLLRVKDLLIDELRRRDESEIAEKAAKAFEKYEQAPVEKELPEGAVPTAGPESAAIAFVAASPSALDAARGEPLVGPAGAMFKTYLERLGLQRSDALLTHVVPVVTKDAEGRPRQPNEEELADWSPWLRKELRGARPGIVVALGRVAKALLGDLADFTLPHPNAVRKFGDSGETSRKLKAVAKRLEQLREARENTVDNLPSGDTDSRQDEGSDVAPEHSVPISKADDEKQIVYGVVLDPYIVDGQNDWAPPADVEKTAHEWLIKSRVIGLRHDGEADAAPVESWVEPYPTPEDYAKAMRGEPHNAYRRKFGEDIVHSGAWVLGTKLSDGIWAQVKAGELGAFSMGGMALRVPADTADMPKVNFIEIGMDGE